MTARDRDLVLRYPKIPWHEPVEVVSTTDGSTHYACRFCIAQVGLKGSAVGKLPSDPETVRAHVRQAHADA
jgi:hypothetical protein